MLLLVRHARPVVDAGRPPAEWPLGPEGEAAAVALGAILRNRVSRPRVLSSPEAKARATALACFPEEAVAGDDRLAEVTRPFFESTDELHEAAAGYLGGVPLEGWESADAVARRFDDCLADLESAGDVVAFTHGTAMTVWLSRSRGLGEPFGWWRDLRMPDAWLVGPPGGSFVRI